MRTGNVRAMQAALLSLPLEDQSDLFPRMLARLSPIVPESIWADCLARAMADIKGAEPDDIPVAEPSEVVA